MSQPKRRIDYRAPDYRIDTVELTVELFETHALVSSILAVTQVGESCPLVLDGENLQLIAVELDGKTITDFECSDSHLTIGSMPKSGQLKIVTQIDPANNTSLEGLYKSAGAFCTQCEAEGFRKITYFMDRPDILARFTVTIEADKARYPHLLSNGNCIGQGELENGRHWAKWQDPFPKPCYLFAIVAGDFDVLEDTYKTQRGREVELCLFVDKGNQHKGQHAMQSLKKSMLWDEQKYGLEYDLDIYMIVAVDFFNMGAMENKGLNVFNSKFVLADSDSATDQDYFHIEAVIAHEYFHNWTGNRVTCRDWFQLSLKEGLTVFRDQQFSADMSSQAITRIQQVKVMREQQFAEDAGPMSHPIRPDEVVEMNNFYTVTVYDKGAEVIRMLHRLLGEEGFRAGMDLYFQRHDGQAVTCDDFVNAMADANDRDLTLFKRWYSQSGTPRVSASYQLTDQSIELSLSQLTKPTADQSDKQPLLLPIDIQLFDQDGRLLLHTVVELTQVNQTFSFEQPNTFAIVINGDFSAPVKIDFEQSDQARLLVALNAADGFSRWDAMQAIYQQHILNAARTGSLNSSGAQLLIASQKSLLASGMPDVALLAECLDLPSFETLVEIPDEPNADGILAAREEIEKRLATELSFEWLSCYQRQETGPYQYCQEDVGKRRLKNLALYNLMLADAEQFTPLAVEQYTQSDNMTDTLGALKALQNSNVDVFTELMCQFELRWQDNSLVMDKWFALQAGAQRKDILTRLDLLKQHAGFSLKNPNRVRSLLGTFAFFNPHGFLNADGSGFTWLTDQLIQLDSINPQVASRIVTPLTQFKRWDSRRQELMIAQLMRLANHPTLSKDVFEKVSKSLQQL